MLPVYLAILLVVLSERIECGFVAADAWKTKLKIEAEGSDVVTCFVFVFCFLIIIVTLIRDGQPV